jgi:gluconolactonase
VSADTCDNGAAEVILLANARHGPYTGRCIGEFAIHPPTRELQMIPMPRIRAAVAFVMAWAAVVVPAKAARGQESAGGEVIPVEVVRTNDYTEGVVVDHDGNLYFSHGKIVTKVTPDGKASTWAETGAPNGHKILADGTHLICDASRHALLHLDASGKELTPAATESDGRPLRGPNDLTLDTASGGVYFTDPASSDQEHPDGSIHFLDRQGVCHTVAQGLAFPNGIVIRPGGKMLLVAESRRNRILSLPIPAPGKLGQPKVLIDLPQKGEGQIDNQPDGIALDAEGNLYVAHYGMRRVQVVSPKGELLRSYPGGNLTTSNVAFAGPKMDKLYMTGGDPGALFRLELSGVTGLTILPPRAGK